MEDLSNFNNIFFIGIGGISMSGLAVLLKSKGKNVSGSDLVKSNITKNLKKQNIKVYYSHRASSVKGSDLVVYSGAISNSNPQMKYAKAKNIQIIERSELLSLVAKAYKNVIAVSGTHGKTTTTAILSYIFIISGLNPTVHIGGVFDYIKGNILVGGKEYFITEACEFRDSFLYLQPTSSIVTNIEPEHLDYFKTFEKEKSSFNKFIENTKQKSYINTNFKKIVNCKEKLQTYGFNSDCDAYAKNLTLGTDGKYSFDCYKGKSYIGNFKLNVFGKHNVSNALAVISICLDYGIDYKAIYLGLKTFNNAHRRFEFIGSYKNCQVISDYAHHPTEILSSINTCKEVFNKKVICIFQPHTYSRTKTLLDSFSKCFNGLDALYILKTYSARESFDYLGSADKLKESILKTNPNFLVKGAYSKNEFLKEIKNVDVSNCVLLFLGAGDIEKLPYKLIKKSNRY